MKKNVEIWIVDDDEFFQMITIENLRRTKENFHVKTFFEGHTPSNLLSTLQATPQNIPDIILLDLNMPVFDGWMFLKEYAKLDENIRKQMRVVICSSSIDPADIHKVRSIKDVAALYEKPLSVQRLLEIFQLKTGNQNTE